MGDVLGKKSILSISTTVISVVIFSVLVHQIYVLDTKKLVTTHLFSFAETSLKFPKNVPKLHLQRDVVGPSTSSIKQVFRETFLYFLMPSAYQTLH